MVDRDAVAKEVAVMMKVHREEMLRQFEAMLSASHERLACDVITLTANRAEGDSHGAFGCAATVEEGERLTYLGKFEGGVAAAAAAGVEKEEESTPSSDCSPSPSACAGGESQEDPQPTKTRLFPSLDLESFDLQRAQIAKLHTSNLSMDFLAPDSRPWCQRLVGSPRFETFFGALILCSVASILFETEWRSVHVRERPPTSFLFVNAAFSVLFAIELLLRVIAARGRFFRSMDTWRALDVLAVGSSLFELSLDITEAMDGAQASQVRILRLLRSVRVLRVIRVARMARFLRALRSLLLQIASALRSLIWSLLLLVLVVFMFAVGFTQAVNDLRSRVDDDSDINPNLITFWSSCSRSGFTLFATVFGGISWDVVILPLDDTGPFSIILFIAYVSFMQLALLNIMTGAFCQNAIDAAARDQELATQAMLANKHIYINQLEHVFEEIDVDHSGGISIAEFEAKLHSKEMQAYFDAIELGTSDVWQLFKLMDSAEANEIGLDEFVFSCLRLKGAAKGVDMARLIWDHSYMSKRIHRFIKRTDEKLDELYQHLRLGSHGSARSAAVDSVAAGRARPTARPSLSSSMNGMAL